MSTPTPLIGIAPSPTFFRLPEYATLASFNLPLFSMYVLLHVLLLALPFTYTPEALFLALFLYFFTICFGVTLGYHRLLCHRSYKTYRPIAAILAFLGCLSFQRGPIWWTACHRLHHREVDKTADPHSPNVSFLWSHLLWPFFRHPELDSPTARNRLARDLSLNPAMKFLEKYYTAINILFLISLFVVGHVVGGFKLAWSFLVWGGFLRIVCCLHITWLVNSVCHIWGYRNYETPDRSRNNWLVAFLTYGEGWHNNHHHDARAARNGHYWYEIDLTYYLIKVMQIIGLAYDIVPLRARLKILGETR